MRYLPGILIVLILAFVIFTIGFFYFAQNLTPEVFRINQETARLEAEIKQLEAKGQYLQRYTEAKIKLQKLNNQKNAQNTGVYKYTLAAKYAILNLWPMWILLLLVGMLCWQRWRLEPKTDLTAENISLTNISVKEAIRLVQDAFKVQEIKYSAEILAREEEITQRRIENSFKTVQKAQTLLKSEPSSEIEATQIEALPIHNQGKFSLTDLFQDPDLEPGYLPLGRNQEIGALVQATPKDLTSIDIVGKPHCCKTTIFEMLVLGAIKLQDDGYPIKNFFIDPHAGLPDSAELFLRPVLHKFSQTVLGEKAIEEGKHIQLLKELETELNQRQEKSYDTPCLMLFIDELHDIFDEDTHSKETYQLLKKLRRLRKGGIVTILVWHDSTKEGAGGIGTGLINLSVSAFVVNATRSKAQIILDKDAHLAVDLPRGSAVLKIPGNYGLRNEHEIIQIPFVQKFDLTSFLPTQNSPAALEDKNSRNMIGDTSEEQKGLENDLSLTSELCKQRREILDLSQGKLARRIKTQNPDTSINQMKISRFERDEITLSVEEEITLKQTLFPEDFKKNPKIIQIAKFLK